VPDETRLIWVDMEMTGLNPAVDRIIEIAIVVTDNALQVVAQSEAIAIAQPDSVLDAMDQWNRSTHGRSGLIDRVKASRSSEADAEQAMLAFLALGARTREGDGAAPAVAQPPPPAPQAPAAGAPAAPGAPAAQQPAPVAEGFLLQAGAFRSSDDAEGMKARLALLGFEARVVPADVNGQPMYRVRIGPFAKQEDAARARARLIDGGIEASVIRQR